MGYGRVLTQIVIKRQATHLAHLNFASISTNKCAVNHSHRVHTKPQAYTHVHTHSRMHISTYTPVAQKAAQHLLTRAPFTMQIKHTHTQVHAHSCKHHTYTHTCAALRSSASASSSSELAQPVPAPGLQAKMQ
jgi:hypothetical protein